MSRAGFGCYHMMLLNMSTGTCAIYIVRNLQFNGIVNTECAASALLSASWYLNPANPEMVKRIAEDRQGLGCPVRLCDKTSMGNGNRRSGSSRSRLSAGLPHRHGNQPTFASLKWLRWNGHLNFSILTCVVF